MKASDVLILGAAAAAAFFIVRKAGGGAAATKVASGTKLVREWQGWKYYSDGTVIDQFGNYYYQGEKIFDSAWGAV